MGFPDADNIPIQVFRDLHGDMLGAWLPLALADILSIVIAYASGNKQKFSRLDILADWGFDVNNAKEKQRESSTEQTLAGWF